MTPDGDGNLLPVLAALAAEAPDILCEWARGSSSSASAEIPAALRRRALPPDPAVELWMGACRALTLARALGGGIPDLPMARAGTSVRWRDEGDGELCPDRFCGAWASGFADGMPWLSRPRVRAGAEARLLAAALRDSLGALRRFVARGGGMAFRLEEVARASAGALSRMLAEVELAHPVPPGDCPVACAAEMLEEDAIGRRCSEVSMRVGRLFSVPLRGLSGEEGEFDASLPGGERFSDKALELLLLGRMRTWLLGACPGASWHPERLIGGNGKPMVEGALRGEPVRLWFQTSRAMPRSALEDEDGRGPRPLIPDIVVAVGRAGAERWLLADAKNYGGEDGFAREAAALIGDADMRGIAEKRVMLIRPDEFPLPPRFMSDPGRPGYGVAFVGMQLGPAGATLPGEVASRLLQGGPPP